MKYAESNEDPISSIQQKKGSLDDSGNGKERWKKLNRNLRHVNCKVKKRLGYICWAHGAGLQSGNWLAGGWNNYSDS